MNCPRCGTPNTKYIDEKGVSRNQRRKKLANTRDKARAWDEQTKNDRLKCKKCGIFEE